MISSFLLFLSISSNIQNNKDTFTWTKNGEDFLYLNINFRKNAESIIEVPQHAKEIDHFSQDILEFIDEHTNLYATQNWCRKCNNTGSSKNWEDTCELGIKVLIEIKAVMEIHQFGI